MTTEISQDLSGRQAPARRQKLNATRRRSETKDFPQNLIFIFFPHTVDLTSKSIMSNGILFAVYITRVSIVLELLCIFRARIWGKGSQGDKASLRFLFFENNEVQFFTKYFSLYLSFLFRKFVLNNVYVNVYAPWPKHEYKISQLYLFLIAEFSDVVLIDDYLYKW